jgi:hypothetical protein
MDNIYVNIDKESVKDVFNFCLDSLIYAVEYNNEADIIKYYCRLWGMQDIIRSFISSDFDGLYDIIDATLDTFNENYRMARMSTALFD